MVCALRVAMLAQLTSAQAANRFTCVLNRGVIFSKNWCNRFDEACRFRKTILPVWWARNNFDSAGRHPYTAAKDSNIARKKVTRYRKLNSGSRHHAFTRVVSLLLFGFIFYGTIVEAAHTHGSVATANAVARASNFSDPATKTKASNTLLGCSDCLICQLHQNFSATLISVPPSSGPSSAGSKSFYLTTVSVHSQTSRPRAGRAPPLISF